MQLSQAPVQIQEEFANGDSSKTSPIPITTGTPGAASFSAGFPALCATPVSSGGIPPAKADMNGILAMLSAIDVWNSVGGGFPYNSAFQTAIGGYPKGARVLRASGNGYWFSTTDNNMTDPDTGGAGWVPDSAFASVYASAQQTLVTGNAKVLWDTVEQDTLGLWNAGAQAFVAKWAGAYRFSGAIYLPAPAAQNMSVAIYKNDVLAKFCSQFPQVSNVPLIYNFDAVIICAASDVLTVEMNIPATNVLAGQSGSNEAYVYGQLEFVGE